MKKIGILGGLGWPSTVAYYAAICRLAEQASRGSDGLPPMPEMAIESLDLAKAEFLLGSDDDEASWAAFDAYHRAGLSRLAQSGADFAVIACNTAHHRLTQITQDIGLPVIGIAEVAAVACAGLGVARVLLLGTATVMRSARFRAVFSNHGIDAVPPRDARSQRTLADTIGALQLGRVPGAAERIRAIVAAARATQLHEACAVYLGCTELPLAFPAHADECVFEIDGTSYLNSAALHVAAAVDCAMRDR